MRWLAAALLVAPFAHAEPVASPPEAPDLEPDPGVVHVRLTAAERPDGAPFLYGYEGMTPGPTIRGRVGQMLVVELTNALDTPTTIHWHGMKVPFVMDGATWRGDPVGPGESFLYTFPLEHAGTFWYHPHFDTDRQVDGGLYGVLVVEDPAEPATDELVLVFDTEGEYDPRDEHPDHGHGHLGRRWRINGQAAPVEYRARGGSATRVRLLNASNVDYLALRWPDLRQIAGGQGLLPAAQGPERLVLAPGQRAEVEWRVGESGFTVTTDRYSLNGGDAHGDPVDLVEVLVDAPAPAPPPVAWPFPGGVVSPDPPYTDIVYAFAGSDRTGDWRINGERFPDITVERVRLGSTPIVEVRNLSPTEHPFHLHGLRFEVLSVNGVPPAARTVDDTWNLRVRDRLRLRVEADNPGEWMAHCHILPHAHHGMMTVLRVADDVDNP